MNPRRHILIFHQAALGDFIMTWPLAMALGRVFAQSRVMYVTGPDKGRLAEAVVGVEWLGVDNGWHTLFGPGDVPDEPVGRVLRATQCVVLFAAGDASAVVERVRQLTGDIPILPVSPNPPAGVHVLTHQLTQLQGHGRLGGYVEQMQTLMRTSGLGGRAAAAGKDIVIHPGSGSAGKNWPLTSFIELASALRSAGRTVQFVIGEVERERMTPADVAAMRAVAPVAEPADLPALRAVLQNASAFIGNDSGPTHLAAVLGLRTVALFGPNSNAEQWSPVGPRVSVLPFSASPPEVVKVLSREP
ncbi:MAG TPA: glycosyltransferase family 9 protein [Tepidisphaeraceae bacterium]|jgi:ADP-heptose:LPS heptosyltransferase